MGKPKEAQTSADVKSRKTRKNPRRKVEPKEKTRTKRQLEGLNEEEAKVSPPNKDDGGDSTDQLTVVSSENITRINGETYVSHLF